MLVNRSNVGQQGGREGGLPTHIFGREGDDYFSLWRRIVRHCENNARASSNVSRAVTRAYRLFFHVPLPHEVNRSLSHNLRFRNSRFVKKYPSLCVSFQNLHWMCVYIYLYCRESWNEEKERGCPVYLWKMTRKEYFDIPFLSCKIVFQIKNVRLSVSCNRIYLILRRVRNRIFFSNKKIIVSFFNDPDLTFL